MRYDYYCTACEDKWEEVQFMNDRDAPLAEPCPKCGETGQIHRGFFTVARVSYDGAQTVLQRAGSGWNDLLTGVKAASGKSNTIETR